MVVRCSGKEGMRPQDLRGFIYSTNCQPILMPVYCQDFGWALRTQRGWGRLMLCRSSCWEKDAREAKWLVLMQ